MEIFIFDMDGVLLRPHGYHRALQNTVRQVGEKKGFGELTLTDEDIARFEALGIANEWHSAALCLSVLTLRSQQQKKIDGIPLEPLFETLAAQSLSVTPRKRGEVAVSHLAQKAGIPDSAALAWIEESEQIDKSPTMQVFQTMILGDVLYEQRYKRPATEKTDSYLKLFDQPLLSAENVARLLTWSQEPSNGSAIMTNRPSLGPDNFSGDPDGSFGKELVGVEPMPLIGFGEASWLADRAGRPWADVIKPNPEHALAAIFAASGWEVEESLDFTAHLPQTWDPAALEHLHGAQITVFEDTPAGMISVQSAGELLNQFELDVSVRKMGIASDPAKVRALEALGAEIYPDVNQALASLDHA